MTKNDFITKLYSLNPKGDADVIFEIVQNCIGTSLPTGEEITLDLLVKRYSDYLLYLKPFNDIKDKQFISKENKIKEIGAYIMTNLHYSDYGANLGDPNDNYLFGI